MTRPLPRQPDRDALACRPEVTPSPPETAAAAHQVPSVVGEASSVDIVRVRRRWSDEETTSSDPGTRADWVHRGPGSGARDWHGLDQFTEQFRQAVSLPDHAPAASTLAAAASRLAAAPDVGAGPDDFEVDGDRRTALGLPIRSTHVVVAGAGRGSLGQFTALGLACTFARWGQPTLVLAPGVHPAARRPRLQLPTLDHVAYALEQQRDLPCPTCLCDRFPRPGGRIDVLFGQGWAALAWLVQSALFDGLIGACRQRYERLVWTLGSSDEALLATELLAPHADHLVVAARRGWSDVNRLERLLRRPDAPPASAATYPYHPTGPRRWAVWYE